VHPLAVRALGFSRPTVPALVIDGVRVQGSLEIARHLERTRPDPPLFGTDPAQRQAIEEAERWGEAVLQPLPRRLFRLLASRSQAVRRWMSAEVVGMPAPGLLAAANKPVAYVMGRRVGASEARVRADLEALPELLAQVERLLEAGTIGGEEPNAADLQILTSIASLLAFADLEPAIGRRPCAAAARALVPALPGPVPEALPRAWLDPVQAGA
jgi:glutathione S-transferase